MYPSWATTAVTIFVTTTSVKGSSRSHSGSRWVGARRRCVLALGTGVGFQQPRSMQAATVAGGCRLSTNPVPARAKPR
jgi:hypothetical protein